MATPKQIGEAVTSNNTKLEPSRKMALASLLETTSIRQRFDDMLGAKAPGFISSIISAVNMNEQLKLADPMSIISSSAIAASLDLPINPSLGFAHLVPYSGKAQFQMGWRGFVQLGMRTGQYKTMHVTAVYKGEIKKINKFTGEIEFNEVAESTGEESEDITKAIGYVAYFRLINGFEKFLYMTKEQCIAHGKKYSKSFGSQNGQWQQNPHAMCMKTVLKMLLNKYGILSIEMQKAMQSDQAVLNEDGIPEYVDGAEETAHTVVPSDAPKNGNTPQDEISKDLGVKETNDTLRIIKGCKTVEEVDNLYEGILDLSTSGKIKSVQYEELVQAMKDRKKELKVK